MSDDFITLLEKRKENLPEATTWEKKTTRFFEGFSYLNIEELLRPHVKKLTHVGVNSLNYSTEVIRVLTINNLDMIENNLKKAIEDVQSLTNLFEELNNIFNYKPGFFNRKTNGEIFLDFFQAQQDNITKKINDLNVKQYALLEAKKEMESNIDKLVYAYIVLDKDLEFLKQAEQYMDKNANTIVKQIYNDFSFDIMHIKTDLLTQEQIIFQKYGAMKILMNNILNCHKNITYLSRTTHSCLFNMVELQHILHLSSEKNTEKEKTAFSQIKDVMSKVTNDLKAISQKPFAALVES